MLPNISHVKCIKADYLLFSSSDLISTTLFTRGDWDHHLYVLSKLIYQGIDSPIVVDIGANLGAYSIPIAKDLQTKNGQVVAFEPQRIIYYQLCGNVFLNSLDNCIAHNMAVGSSSSTLKIPTLDYSKSKNNGAYSLLKEAREFEGIEEAVSEKFEEVPCITLDSFKLNNKISLLKIDVEGCENDVIEGSTEFLESNYYPPIIFECWSAAWFASQKNNLFERFKKIGYQITNIVNDDYLAQHPSNGSYIDIVKSEKSISYNRIK